MSPKLIRYWLGTNVDCPSQVLIQCLNLSQQAEGKDTYQSHKSKGPSRFSDSRTLCEASHFPPIRNQSSGTYSKCPHHSHSNQCVPYPAATKVPERLHEQGALSCLFSWHLWSFFTFFQSQRASLYAHTHTNKELSVQTVQLRRGEEVCEERKSKVVCFAALLVSLFSPSRAERRQEKNEREWGKKTRERRERHWKRQILWSHSQKIWEQMQTRCTSPVDYTIRFTDWIKADRCNWKRTVSQEITARTNFMWQCIWELLS